MTKLSKAQTAQALGITLEGLDELLNDGKLHADANDQIDFCEAQLFWARQRGLPPPETKGPPADLAALFGLQ
jgi:hypothetical protein